MEANVAVKLFEDAVASGVSYSTNVGDDDSTTENHSKHWLVTKLRNEAM